MTFFFINSKTLWKHIYCDTILIFQQFFWINSSSRWQMFLKIGILKSCPVLEFLSNKVTGLKGCSFIKQRPQHRWFHVNIAKLWRTAFFIKYLRWLLLNKVKTNVKSTWFFLPDWLYYVIKSIMTLIQKIDEFIECKTTKIQQQKHKQTVTRKTIR